MRTSDSVTLGAWMALGSAAIFLPSAVKASGFQLQEQSASGLGVAYAGMAAGVQDASTVFWNPAGIPEQLAGAEFTGATVLVKPTTRFQSPEIPSAVDGGDGGVSGVVPSLYVRVPLRSDLGVGLAINAPFGLSTDWSSPWAGMYQGLVSKSQTLNINPAAGMKLRV